MTSIIDHQQPSIKQLSEYITDKDFDSLVNLSQYMNPAYRLDRARIQAILHSGIVYVLSVDSKLCGVLYTVRADISSESSFTYDSILNYANLNAPYCYWIHLILEPEFATHSTFFHAKALEEMWRIGVKSVRPLTHCHAFHLEHQLDVAQAMHAYVIQHKKSDRNLYFHSSRGAHFLHILESYNALDKRNGACAVVMEYLRAQPNATSPLLLTVVQADTAALEKLVQSHLPDPSVYDTIGTWFEMGMDSISIMEFHRSLEAHFKITLPVEFLFNANSPRLLEQHLLHLPDASYSSMIHDSHASTTSTSQELDYTRKLAIVGIGCKFPGVLGGPNLETCEALWDAFYENEPSDNDFKTIHDECRFDMKAFGTRITLDQAHFIPPMQRWILECVQSALEDAPPDFLTKMNHHVGVFVGAWETTADSDTVHQSNTHRRSAHAISGVSNAILANRVSFAFGLTGPSIVVDTACSSSLVAIDYARKSILSGQCTAAIVIGCNEVRRARSALLQDASFLSPLQACFSFDERANGYARSEGCGAIVICDPNAYPNSDVRAFLCATSVNQDGATMNMHAPNPQAQIRLIQHACRDAALKPDDIHFVEAHGTGTVLGDPIEVHAIQDALGKPRQDPLYITSSKAQFGHMEAAAGILGIIKSILSLQARRLPPNRRFQNLNPNIKLELDKGRLQIVGSHEVKLGIQLPRCGISSFGFGGTNAHVILEAGERHSLNQRSVIDWQSRCETVPYAIGNRNQVESTMREPIQWRDVPCQEFLQFHRLGNLGVVPAAFMVLCMIDSANRQKPKKEHRVVLNEIHFSKIVLCNQVGSLSVETASSHNMHVLLDDSICSSAIVCFHDPADDETVEINLFVEECQEILIQGCDPAFYASLGNRYGGPFTRLGRVCTNASRTRIISEIDLSGLLTPTTTRPWEQFLTVIIDVALHGILALLDAPTRGLPTFVRRIGSASFLQIQKTFPASCVCYISVHLNNSWDIWICDAEARTGIIGKLTDVELGVFDNASSSLLFHDEWSVIEPSDMSESASIPNWDFNIVASDMKSLHTKMKGILTENSKASILVTVPHRGFCGYLRSCRLEYPLAIIKTVISLSGILPPWGVVALHREHEILVDADGESVLCRRLTPISDAEKETLHKPVIQVTADSVVVVTGGLGALGSAICRKWLQTNLPTTVIVLGRKAPPLDQVAAPRMIYLSCDISDHNQVAKVLQQYSSRITGIFHCAGTLEDHLIKNMSSDHVDVPFAPKVQGIVNLLNLSMPKLEFVILVSSIVSATGSISQSNYASANGFLDEFAYSKQGNLPRIKSVQLGPLAGFGMANVGAGYEARWWRLGFPVLDLERVVDTIFNISDDLGPVVMITHLLSDKIQSTDPYYECVAYANVTTNSKNDDKHKKITTILETILQCAKTCNVPINANQPWREAGMDSLALIELRNFLQSKYPTLRMSETILFDYSTPEALAQWVYSESSAATGSEISSPEVIFEDPLSPSNFEVIGAACRLPGNIASPEDFFEFLMEQRCAMSEIPLGRFDASKYFSDKKGVANKIYTKSGAFLDDIESFDHIQFGISYEEALAMDPQQRIALQVAYEALKDAGFLDEAQEKPPRIGVFVGSMTCDWDQMQTTAGINNAFTASGHCVSILANRISYAFGLRGPSITIDTACSSSLVALDLACSAIAKGDCQVALVLGVNLILSPKMYLEECAANMLSEDGFCHTFSKAANGYARGEGCVALVVAPPEFSQNAEAWGTVCATAVNQDGRSANLTSPSGLAQQEVIRLALSRAQIQTSDVYYVETHGTGTLLGDPLEVEALSRVFERVDHPIALGAVKASLGHGEGAAGVTGVLKALLCLRHGQLPGNVSLETSKDINPKVSNVASRNLLLLPKSEIFELPSRSYAGVSGFGFGGTNAHVIVTASQSSTINRQSYTRMHHSRRIAPQVEIRFDPPKTEQLELLWQPIADENLHQIPIEYVFEVLRFGDVLAVIHRFSTHTSVDLCFVIRNGTMDMSGIDQIEKASLFGLIRSLRLEHPSWNLAILDLERDAPLPKQFVKVLHKNGDQILSKDRQMYVPHLCPVSRPHYPTSLFIQRSSPHWILLTGATGGVAQAIRNYFRKYHQGCRFVCTSRRVVSNSVHDDADSLWIQCDLASEASVAMLRSQLDNRGIVINTILHAAGLLESIEGVKLTEASWRRIMEVKLNGALSMDKQFPNVSDFVTFSSTSSIFGMRNGAAYAGANAALTAFAEYRASLGKKTTNILWDMWNDVGMAAQRDMTSSWRGLDVSHACQALVGAMTSDKSITNLVVIRTDWAIMQNHLPSYLLTKLLLVSENQKSTRSQPMYSDSDSKSIQTPAEILEFIMQQARLFVQYDADIEASLPWNEIGFDSLSMVSFAAKLNQFLKSDELSDTVMLDYPTPAQLATLLSQIIASRSPGESDISSTRQDKVTTSHIAIIGMALRFPGPRTNRSPLGFWEFLCSDEDAICEIPSARFTIPELWRDEIYTSRGGFLHPDLFYRDIERDRFHLSGAEFQSMDPHQIFSLEVAHEALSNARALKQDLGTVGVFVGAQNTEFAAAQQLKQSPVTAFTATGTSLSIIANRISYTFDLKGPSMTIDTACSSSLCALDAAIKAIRMGDCDSALVLGVDLMLSPHRYRITCGAKMLSKNGRCATFSDAADGYARGEGCGAVVITREDPKISSWATIRGVAVTQDGRSANLTSPVGPAQEACIKKALERAQVAPDCIDFIETHGTGTSLGDPQEVQAIANVFTNRTKPLILGAVKTRIGHLEAAAGIAGLIKAVLVLYFRQVPPNLHCKVINPKIERILKRCPLQFPSNVMFLNPSQTLYAGVSSFGFGGTNAHVILSSSSRLAALDSVRIPNLQPRSLYEYKEIDFEKDTLMRRWMVQIHPVALHTLKNHKVGTLSVIPATTYIEILNPIIESLHGSKSYCLDHLVFHRMMMIENCDTALDIIVELVDGSWKLFGDDRQTLYAEMRYTLGSEPDIFDSQGFKLADTKHQCTDALFLEGEFYNKVGNAYSGPFQRLSKAWSNPDRTLFLGNVILDASVSSQLQPSVWLDVCSHVGIATIDVNSRNSKIYAKSVSSYTSACAAIKQAADIEVWAVLKPIGLDSFDMWIYNSKGVLLAFVEHFTFGYFLSSTKKRILAHTYIDQWVPANLSTASTISREILNAATVVDLHQAIHQRIMAQNFVPLLVLIHNSEQIGYLKCLHREYPDWDLKFVSGQTWSEPLKVSHLGSYQDMELRVDQSSGMVQSRRLLEVSLRDIVANERVISVRTGGTYLITGGNGSLGRKIGTSLIAKGAKRVILVGRASNPSIPAGMQYIACDVSSENQVRDRLAHLLLHGIFHCAGELHDGTVASLSKDSFELVNKPKCIAATTLWNCFGNCDTLDSFVLCSSISGSFGSAGQASYGAANFGLDAFAEMRTTEGHRCNFLSVRWGPWGDGGMASASESRWSRLGYQCLDAESALEALFGITIGLGPVVTICNFTGAACDPQDSYFALVTQKSSLHAKPIAQSPPMNASTLRALVMQTAESLAIDGIKLDDSWRDAGFDSLSMVEFRNIIQQKVNLAPKLHDGILFDYPTPKLFIEYLVSLTDVSTDSVARDRLSVSAHEQSGHPVITAAAVRLPGGASNMNAFWKVLCSGKDCLTKVPVGRFNIDAVFVPSMVGKGTSYTDQGAFLDHVEYFDFAKFGISEQEALSMDPQQRLALEVAYEALVQANVLNTGKKIGVYVGVMTNDWVQVGGPIARDTAYTASGHANSIIANRISYVLGLCGPSLAIDTACSSSLVALDVACAGLGRDDCDVALVLGVNLILSENLYVEECAAKMLSPSGKCHSFSNSADGYARGEGCVAIVIEKEEISASAPPLARILSSAVNQDGKSANLTSPNGTAQQQVIQMALDRANCTPEDIDVVETHGTGTLLGDPIEIAALSRVFGSERTKPMYIGALKSVFGHGEGAAGLSALVKAIICLRMRQIPGITSLKDKDSLSLKVKNVAQPFMQFPVAGTISPLPDEAICGISGFGFGGTNAHVIIQGVKPTDLVPSPSIVVWQKQLCAWRETTTHTPATLHQVSVLAYPTRGARREAWQLYAHNNGYIWHIYGECLHDLRCHRVGTTSLMPLSMYLDVVTSLPLIEQNTLAMQDIVLKNMLALHGDDTDIYLYIDYHESSNTIRIQSIDQQREYVEMRLTSSDDMLSSSKILPRTARETCIHLITEAEIFYSTLGNQYESPFTGLVNVKRNDNGSMLLGTVRIPDTCDSSLVYASWLDSSFHVFLASLTEPDRKRPVFARSVGQYGHYRSQEAPKQVQVVCHVLPNPGAFHMYVYDMNDSLLCVLRDALLGLGDTLNSATRSANQEHTLEGTDVGALVSSISKRVVGCMTTDDRAPWREAGFDSLSMIEFRNQLQIAFRERISFSETILFDLPTKHELVAWIEQQLYTKHTNEKVTSKVYKKKEIVEEPIDSTGPIAITGIACRLPGNVASPQAFWDLLNGDEDAFSEIPLGRFDYQAFYNPDINEPGCMYTSQGAFISDVDVFDNISFGISDAEVLCIDPQQRICLQVASEALQDANIETKNVGVYVGNMTNDWSDIVRSNRDRPSPFSASGHSTAIIANRVSYVLGLVGPSMTINTACSSSLVAVDVACAALHRGDCEAALVIGVNLILSADVYIEECASRMLSPEGKCFTFSSKANGYARGEACVGFVLTLPKLASPEMLWGFIAGSAVNQDGTSANLTSPNGQAQQSVIRKALNRAQIDPARVAYVESHGTGTLLGDGIEIEALGAVFGAQKLVVGTVKPCVGHTEGAAGLVSMLKSVLCIQHGFVPANMHMFEISEHIQRIVDTRDIVLPRVACSIPKYCYAGVSAFGFGGTNAHVILQSVKTRRTTSVRQRAPSSLDMNDVNVVYESDDDDLIQTPEEHVRIRIGVTPKRIHWNSTSKQVTFHTTLQTIDHNKSLRVQVTKNIFHIKKVQDILRIIRGLDASRKLRLVFVTTRMEAGTKESVQIAAAWGFARSIRLEHRNWKIYLIDSDEKLYTNRGISILAEENEVFIRGNEWKVPRLMPLKHVTPLSLKKCLPIDEMEYILVTGASGGIASSVMQYLRKNVGHRRFVGVSRSFKSLSSSIGPDTDYIQISCNIGSAQDVQALAEKLRECGVHVKGVLHCAGVLIETPLSRTDEKIFQEHWNAKVQGAQYIEAHFPDLEFFVTFGSTSALFGMSHGACYASANAALEALARGRNARGLRTYNIAWDIWNETGMAFDRKVRVSDRGLSTSTACQVLCGILGNRNYGESVVVIDADLRRLDATLASSLLKTIALSDDCEDIPQKKKYHAVTVTGAAGEFTRVTNSTKQQTIHATLQACGIESMSANFEEFGMDSLRAIEVVNAINEQCSVKLSPTFFMDFHNGTELTNHILRSLDEIVDEPKTQKDGKENMDALTNPWLEVPMAPKLRLYCFAYAGGHPSIFNSWLEYLPAYVQVCPVAMPGYGKQSHPTLEHRNIQSLSQSIASVLPTHSPYALVGACLGAIIAYEVALCMKVPPEHFFAFTCANPRDYTNAIQFTFDGVLKDSPLFVSSKTQNEPRSFLALQQRDRLVVVEQLRGAGFFKDQSVIDRLHDSPEYFEHIMLQLSSQLHLAESYNWQHFQEKLQCPLTSVAGQCDDTIPDGLCEKWINETEKDGNVVIIPDAGHFLIQTHPKESCAVIVKKHN